VRRSEPVSPDALPGGARRPGYPSHDGRSGRVSFRPDEPGSRPRCRHARRHAIVERGATDWAYRFDRGVPASKVTPPAYRDALPAVACPAMVATAGQAGARARRARPHSRSGAAALRGPGVPGRITSSCRTQRGGAELADFSTAGRPAPRRGLRATTNPGGNTGSRRSFEHEVEGQGRDHHRGGAGRSERRTPRGSGRGRHRRRADVNVEKGEAVDTAIGAPHASRRVDRVSEDRHT